MGAVRTYLNQEQSFLESGTYGRGKVEQILLTESPGFRRDMYEYWRRYYQLIVEHLRNIQRDASGENFRFAMAGDEAQGMDGQNQVLARLIADVDVEIANAKGNTPLQEHLACLRALLDVELRTNQIVCDELPANW